MTGKRSDIAASVAARLLNRARQTGDDYQTLLRTFCFERLLYRIGMSDLRDRFVLKGAMLLRLWSEHPYRATHDMDLLRNGDGSFEAIRQDIRDICAVTVAPDAILFDVESLHVEAIRGDDKYAGTRATLPARCGSARIILQIDLGAGDSVWPGPRPCFYPVLLDFPPPDVLTYPREAVVAEKLEAIVVLGDRNSRIKDFFDLHYLARHFEFDRATLSEAVRRTFERRRTPILEEVPIGLTPTYWENPSRPAQVRAFARRAKLALPEDPGRDLGALLHSFLLPIIDDLRREERSEGTWRPGGPWR
jgi:hypothetical protein